MAYYDEEPIKRSIMKSIDLLAQNLEVYVQFEDPETISYGELVALRDDLVSQYNDKMFISQGLKENGFR